MTTTIGLTASEVRTYAALHIRAEKNAAGQWQSITGRAVPYREWANVGWYAESWEPGALAKSIQESARALPLLAFHNAQTWPIGAAEDWTENRDGLDGKWGLADTVEAQRAAELAAGGFLTGLSIGFVPIRASWLMAEEWDPDRGLDYMDRCTREEARLVEVSMTPTPAFAGAMVDLVRSAERPNRPGRAGRGSREVAAWRSYVDKIRGAS